MKVPPRMRKILDQLDSEDDQQSPILRPIRIQVSQEYAALISQLAEAGVLVLADGKKPVPIRQAGVDEETGHIWISTKQP